MHSHWGEMYVSDVCKQAFSNVLSLNRQKLADTVETAYICDERSKAFSHQPLFLTHTNALTVVRAI